jgi:hypothetical protein
MILPAELIQWSEKITRCVSVLDRKVAALEAEVEKLTFIVHSTKIQPVPGPSPGMEPLNLHDKGLGVPG